MIDEPIVMSAELSFSSISDANQGKTVMIIETVSGQETLGCYRIAVETPSDVTNLFSVHKQFKNDRPFWIRDKENGINCWIDTEHFVEFLMDNHADYLEWFLFHPEWLGA